MDPYSSQLVHVPDESRDAAIARGTAGGYELQRDWSPGRHPRPQLERALEQVGVGLATLSLDGRFLDANEALCRMLGRSRQALLRAGFASLCCAVDAARETRVLREVGFNGEAQRLELCWAHADGRSVYLDARLQRLEEVGEPNAILMVAIDVSDRIAAERSLRRREEELARVQRIGAVAGVDFEVAECLRGRRSPEYLRLHGLPADTEVESHADWRARVHPDDRDRAERALFGALAGDATTLQYEYRIIRPSDGETRWIHARLDLERDPAGRAQRLVGAHIDVTDYKRLELALRASEGRYRSLFESMDEGLCVVELVDDAQGQPVDYRFLETNPAFDLVLGLGEVTGICASELSPDRQPLWLDTYQRVAASGTPARFAAELPEGGRTFRIHAFRIGKPCERRVAVLFTDISRSREAERILRWNQKRQSLLLEFGDAARAIADPRRIMATSARMIGHQFAADRAGYAEFDPTHGASRVVDLWSRDGSFDSMGEHPPAVVGEAIIAELARGKPIVVNDVASDRRLTHDERAACARAGIGAFVAAPLLRRPGSSAIVFVHQHGPRRWTREECELVGEYGLRSLAELDRARAEDALRSSEQRLRQFGEASSDILWIRDAASLQFEFLGPAFAEIFGADNDTMEGGEPARWIELVVAEDRAGVEDNLRRVAEGEQVVQEFRILRPDNGEERWIRDTSFPIRDADGQVQRIGGIARDVTGHKRTGDRMQVLIAELQHRTRNLIAVIRALVDKTSQEHPSSEAFRGAFYERLEALARVQALLSRLEDDKVRFDELLQEELGAQAAFDSHRGRIVLEGPRGVRLRSGSVQTLALALHELTTNAVKYGALSTPEGRLHVRWHVARDDADASHWLHVDWRESGVQMPGGDETGAGGYGRELIERALPFQLGARTSYRMAEDGVHCAIAVSVPDARTGKTGHVLAPG